MPKKMKKVHPQLVEGEYDDTLPGPVEHPEQVCDIFRDLKDEAKETMLGLYLDAELTSRLYAVLGVGSDKSVSVRFKEIFYNAITIRCPRFILIHNHPSGTAEPSPADQDAMRALHAQSRVMDIGFLDYIIVAGDTYWSMYETFAGGAANTNYQDGAIVEPLDFEEIIRA